MYGSVHERHRSSLEALAAGGHLEAVTAAAQGFGAEPTHPPRTLRARLSADPELLATLVIAVGPRPKDAVRVHVWPARPAHDPAYVTDLPDIGWLGAWPLTDDPVAATADGLGGGDSVELVRYHPGKRATVRVTSRRRDDGSVRYAKVFSDDRGRARHELAEQLYAAAAGGRLGFRVARPDRYDSDRFVMWQHDLSGVPGTQRLQGREGPALASRLGAALGSFPRSGLRPSRRLTEEDELARVERGAAELASLVPGLADRAHRLLDRMTASRTPIDPSSEVVVHGSPDPSQWLVGGPDDDGLQPGLLDFDRCSLGAPEHDVACFLAHVDAASSRRIDSAGVNAAFLAGYQDVFGPLDAGRVERYRSLRRLGKAVRSARSLRPDGDRRADRALAAAERTPEPAES